LPLAQILSSPALAQKVASNVATVKTITPTGREISASFALPEVIPSATLLLVHEWYGLNDYIKSMAAAFAGEGYATLAVDLYDGVVGTDAATAGFAMRNVKPDEARETMVTWADWLRGHDLSTGKVGMCGWCFGGGWALDASLATPVDATVIYYGNVAKSAEELAALKGPVLGHFGSKDTYINSEMVEGFQSALREAGKVATLHTYSADHAFANPTTARYDDEDAALAWTRTLEFLKKNLA
jgi:carboxymethylenebutenolidase